MGLNMYIIVAGILSFYVIQRIVLYIQVTRFKIAHGCEPEHRLPQSERIIGWELYKTQVKASQDKTVLESSLKRNQKNGYTWSAGMMGKTFFNTSDPENIKALLATNFKDFGLGDRIKPFGPLLGSGIFTTDGAQWEHSRALIRPNFTRSQVADLETFETHIQELITKIPRNGSTIDLQTLFFRLTLDSATEFLFGESVNSLSAIEGSVQERFGTAFDFAQGRLGNRSRLGLLVHLYRDTEFNEACKTVHRFVDNIVHKALERVSPQDVEKSAGGDGTDRYVFLDELVRATRDPKQLRDELLNILLAGRDTTASLLSNTFHVLARRPDIFEKLVAEVNDLQGAKPDYEKLRSMKYLKNVLSESLRLYPVVPGNARFANKATTIPRGGGRDGKSPIYIPKRAVVAYSIYTMHRRKDIYGEDALEFRPERWNQEEGLRPGWGYLPFNGGPRICVGQQFALAEASYTIVRLLQEFSGIEDRDGTPWIEQLGLTVASANGVKVAMIPR